MLNTELPTFGGGSMAWDESKLTEKIKAAKTIVDETPVDFSSIAWDNREITTMELEMISRSLNLITPTNKTILGFSYRLEILGNPPS